MHNLDLSNDFKYIEEVLNNYINMKPVYKDGELYALNGEVFSTSKSQDYTLYSGLRFELDVALAVLSRVMPEKYSAFGVSDNDISVIVLASDVVSDVIKEVIDMYPIINEFDSGNGNGLESLDISVRTMLSSDIDRVTVGIANDRFERLEKLVYQIDEMKCFTNTYELVEALRNRRISNINKSIDPGMLVFYSLFRNNKNIWMNFSCEGHVAGKLVDDHPVYELDESYVMLDFNDIFNESMDDIVEQSFETVKDMDPYKELFENIGKYGLVFKAIFSRAVSNKGWTYRVSIRFSSADDITSPHIHVLKTLNGEMLSCLYAICEEINIRTMI